MRLNAAMTSRLLFVAACLEVGGDVIVRVGRKSHVGFARLGIIALGGAVLLSYGIFVNIAPADFGRHYLSRVLSVECQTQSKPDSNVERAGARCLADPFNGSTWSCRSRRRP